MSSGAVSAIVAALKAHVGVAAVVEKGHKALAFIAGSSSGLVACFFAGAVPALISHVGAAVLWRRALIGILRPSPSLCAATFFAVVALAAFAAFPILRKFPLTLAFPTATVTFVQSFYSHCFF